MQLTRNAALRAVGSRQTAQHVLTTALPTWTPPANAPQQRSATSGPTLISQPLTNKAPRSSPIAHWTVSKTPAPSPASKDATEPEMVQAALRSLAACPKPIDKYMFLRRLMEADSDTYFALLMGHTELTLPFIYTPTVGEACQNYHLLPGMKTRGLYLTLNDKGSILNKLKAWPTQNIRVIVVTDGERILGLGDLGTGGMGISEGKITLYTVAAGVDPGVTLPICLDVGTNNKVLLEDPDYKGLRQPRATGAEYDAFLAEFMAALRAWQPHVLLQFEDFGNTNAFRLLETYQNQACCFNDDIQGTAAITLAALLAAVKASGLPLSQQRILFSGAGEAGTGIGELIAYCLHRRTGVTMEEARKSCIFMDSKGLVCAARKAELQHHKLPFAHDLEPCADLLDAIHKVKPTALIGVSTIPKSFNEAVIRAMTEINDVPIIFPLSNPTSKAECTFEEAVKWSDGHVLFASGSPFDPLLVYAQSHRLVGDMPAMAMSKKRLLKASQANNAYVFPALGFAAILTRATNITEECFLVAAESLVTVTDLSRVMSDGALFPSFDHILEVSEVVAAIVALHMVNTGLGTRPAALAGTDDIAVWRKYVHDHMWHGAKPTSRAPAMAAKL